MPKSFAFGFTVGIPLSVALVSVSGRPQRGLCMAAESSSLSISAPSVENVVLIGSGPAGYTAAIYAARANLKPVVFEGIVSGVPGGQLMTTDSIENFPGFPDGITGPDLMLNMRRQAETAGADLVKDDVVAVDFRERPFVIETRSNGNVRAHSVIIATGASARRLGILGEEVLWSRGISACAICDGTAPIYAGKELAVVGGGDSACEEAVYLTKYATRVHLLVRKADLRASKIMQDRARNHPNVVIHFQTEVIEALAHRSSTGVAGSPLRALRLKDTVSGKTRELEVRGLFYAVGHSPNTIFLKGSNLKLSPSGYLITAPGSTATNIPGVFAAGDVADSEWRQAITAAGTGCMAALASERYLTENELGTEYHIDDASLKKRGKADVEATETEAESEVAQRDSDDELTYDPAQTWHKGQFALRRLYHESDRPLVVKVRI
jgi:thioredoxin reductase (NADPH)